MDALTAGFDISIHAPREGSDSRGPSLTSPLEVFLSTLPARGATQFCLPVVVVHQISIHAPREGSDARAWKGQQRPE